MSKEQIEQPDDEDVGTESSSDEHEYDGPFKLFSWAKWEGMLVQVYPRFTRFRWAIERGQTDTALLVALEMHEMAEALLEEVYAQMSSICQTA